MFQAGSLIAPSFVMVGVSSMQMVKNQTCFAEDRLAYLISYDVLLWIVSLGLSFMGA